MLVGGVRVLLLLLKNKKKKLDHVVLFSSSLLNNNNNNNITSTSSSDDDDDGDVSSSSSRRLGRIDTDEPPPQLDWWRSWRRSKGSSSFPSPPLPLPLPRVSLFQSCFAVETVSSLQFLPNIMSAPISMCIRHPRQSSCDSVKSLSESSSSTVSPFSSLCSPRSSLYQLHNAIVRQQHSRYMSNASVTLKTDRDVVRFCFDKPSDKNGAHPTGKKMPKRKMSKKAKVNELRMYRLKAKKKMTSPNPEVRIRYKLEKAKRKEAWLIEKLRKFEAPRHPAETYDPEILTEEEIFYLKRTGEKKKNYVPVGRRGVFGGVVLNMHLHWKRHETVKVVCKPCKPGQVHEYAEELSRLSEGIVIDIRANNTIIFYRGKNYVQPQVLSPPDTLSKNKALEKYKYEQSLEHTSQFIEKLGKELEEYHKHVARYRKSKEAVPEDSRKVSDGGDTMKE